MITGLPQNIYLHFLDRELRRSVQANWSSLDVFGALLGAVCLSPGGIICSYSHLWESHDLLASGISVLQGLIQSGLLRPVSGHATSAEFLESREMLYAHDAKRYPFYFKQSLVRKLNAFNPTETKSQGATAFIEQALRAAIEGKGPSIVKPSTIALQVINKGLINRENSAITGTIFEKYTSSNQALISTIRREISHQYTRHYLQQYGADIMTGLYGLMPYDNASRAWPLFEYRAFATLIECIGFRITSEHDALAAIEHCAVDRNSAAAAEFLRLWSLTTRFSGSMDNLKSEANATHLEVAGIISNLRRHSENWTTETPTSLSFELMCRFLRKVNSRTMIKTTDLPPNVRAVFIIATDSEWESFAAVAQKNDVQINELILPRLAAWKLQDGKLNDCILVRSEMGGKGPASSPFVVSDVISQVQARYYIMPGIAFGLKEDKTKMGDLLVATSIRDYETVRQGEIRIIERGDRYNTGIELLSKARMVATGRSDIHFGEVLSGDKLVDDPVFSKQLKERFPNALGGEMEGTGLAAACHRYQCEWLLAKAICDWGKGKTDEHQENAGRKAVEFCWELQSRLL